MANIFDTSSSIAPVTQNQTAITRPVEDNTTATAIQAVAGLATKAYGDVVSANAANEAQNILNNPQEQEIPEIQPYVDRLGQLADGVKAGMQRRKAQTMARAVMAEAINQHPYFAKEIRQRGATLFGIGSTGGAGKADIAESPEEKALNEYRASVTELQLQLGVSTETAQTMLQQQKSAQMRKLTAENFTDDIYLGVNDATLKMQDDIFKAILGSPTGTISPDQVRGFNITVERSAVLLQRSLMESASKRGAVTQDTFATIDNQVKAYKTNMKSLVNDQSLTTWMTKNNDLAAQMITAWGNQNYGGMIQLAKNQTIPDSIKEALFRASSGDAKAKALIASNPYLADLQANTEELGVSLRKAYASSINGMYGYHMTDEERRTEKVPKTAEAATTTLTLNGEGGAQFNKTALEETNGGAQEQIDAALNLAPEGITRWLKPQYEAQFSGDKALRKYTIDHELRVVSRTLRGRMFSMMENPEEEWADFSITSAERAIPEEIRRRQQFIGGTPNRVIRGKFLDDYSKSRIVDMIRVLNKYPEVWENRAEDPEEFVEKMLKSPNSMNENNRNKLRLGDKPNDGINRGIRSAAAQDAGITERIQALKAKGVKLEDILDAYDAFDFQGGSTGDVRDAVITAFNS